MSFPHKPPSIEELTALHRLRQDRDFGIFTGWLETELKALKDALCVERDVTSLHQLQGQAQTLKAICKAINESTATLKQIKGQ